MKKLNTWDKIVDIKGGNDMKFSIIKREPSYFFNNIHEDLTRFLKDTFGDMEFMDKGHLPVEMTFRPAIEVRETSKNYKIKVELAGVKKEDIDVDLYENGIVLNAQAKYENKEEKENIHISEFRYGNFTRTIPFEHPVNPESAKSEFKHGVLKIILDKKEPEKTEESKKLKID